MIVGVPKETKADEKRVGLMPVGAHMLVEAGHTVYVEQGATDGSGVPIEDYMEARQHKQDFELAPNQCSIVGRGYREQAIEELSGRRGLRTSFGLY